MISLCRPLREDTNYIKEYAMPTPLHLLVVRSSVDSKIENDWNDWYDRKHLPEIAQCPGFMAGSRYISVDEHGRHRYVAIYEIADPNALTSKEFIERRGWGPFSGLVEYESRVYSLINAPIGSDR